MLHPDRCLSVNNVRVQVDSLREDSYSGYQRYVRPALARQQRSLGFDVEFEAAQGDHLRFAKSPGTPEVVDLVGGYGASLFGHNHPDLVAAARACLDSRKPFSAQGSLRPSAAKLATVLSSLVGQLTGAEYVVVFGCTGADAVEAALKHATMAWSRRLGSLRVRLSDDLRRASRDGYADATPFGHRDTVGQILATSVAVVAAMSGREPLFVALEGSFHGKTAGASAISDLRPTVDGLGTGATRCLRLHRRDWTPESIPAVFDAERSIVYTVDVDSTGAPRPVPVALSTIAACFAEPIQGEGGVCEVPNEVLRGLRALADLHGAALVFDEIQSGMGRTGEFLASTSAGVQADYYLLSKSLGGGLAKISALMVAKEVSVDDFSIHHTSTFAEDDFSADVAVAALELRNRIKPLITAVGDRLGAKLDELVARYPDVFTEARGRGLLRGIKLAPPTGISALLERAFIGERLGYIVAGHLLPKHQIRLLPTLSAPSVLRIQPSAFLSEIDLDRCVSAMAATAELLRNGDLASLMSHLAGPVDPAWVTPRAPEATVRSGPVRPARSPAEPVRVAFLANLNTAADLRSLAPELAPWSDRQLANLMDRMLGEAPPIEVARVRVASPKGRQVEVIMMAVPLTSAQVVACQRAGLGSFLRASVLAAVERAIAAGAQVVGLGGYTSIVTAAGRDVIEDRVRVTTGNSLTAACALDQLRDVLEARGTGHRHVAVVGAIGNIGAVLTELILPHADSMTLLGSSGSESRLVRLRDRLGAGIPVTVTSEMNALVAADVVLTATNAVEPIIRRAHLATDRPVTVCDLAVPGDVDPAVIDVANVTVIAGGRTLLPMSQDAHVPAADLPRGVVYSCLAETILLGFEPDTASCSYGALTPESVRQAGQLARRHEFQTLLAGRGSDARDIII